MIIRLWIEKAIMIGRILSSLLIIVLSSLSFATAQQRIEIPSSFNPVGSGARALGMGGAFIAVADDATAASWNPGGLVQLEKPEFSIVLSATHRVEDNTFGKNSEANGKQSVSVTEINYFSIAMPFKFTCCRAAAVSINYQQLYDMHREWTFDLSINEPGYAFDQNVDYMQSGTLSAVGIAYSTEITSAVSAGVTLNIWDSGLNPNSWKQETSQTGNGLTGATPFVFQTKTTNQYDFSGYNMNIGLRWQIVINKAIKYIY